MKIAVSFLSSYYSEAKTIEMIDNSIADYIHVDLMDGKYVENKNFTISGVMKLLGKTKKPLDIHLMVEKPEKYIDDLALLNAVAITIHPSTTKDPVVVINSIKSLGLKVGIAINPDEDIKNFEKYFALVDQVLLMSVVPGKGGQEFMEEAISRLELLQQFKEKYGFMIAIDGGINEEVARRLPNVDLMVSGAYVCRHANMNEAIRNLNLR